MNVRKFIGVTAALAVLYLSVGSNVSADEGSFPPLPEALAAMKSNLSVKVSTITVPTWNDPDNYYYAFEPRRKQQNLGFIIYPGAYVDPQSYAPAAQEIAKAGYLVFIVKMPGDLAIVGIPRALDILAAYPDTTQWVIGGHSLGGVSASGYVKDHPDKMKGVVLWASYGSDVFTIHDSDVRVIVLFGTKDGLATPAKVEAGKPYLPDNTTYIPIEGGNHTNFGYYDTSPDPVQPGDNSSDITRKDQQKIIVAETLALLDGISGREPGACPAVAILGEDDPGIATLRQFRDTVLANSALGNKLIDSYYNNGSVITGFIERNPAVRSSAQTVIRLLLPAVQRILAAGK